jgi:putative transposase
MINRKHELSVVRQARLLGFSRGSVYYSPRPVSDGDLALTRRIDELHLDYPFAGSRMLQGLLRGEGRKRDFPCALTAALWLDRSCMEGDIRLD